jgi:hypothetical protein
MEDRLSAYECKALKKLSDDPAEFLIWGELVGIGRPTLALLIERGSQRLGPSRKYSPEIGWRITDDGWAMHVRRDSCGTIGETVQRENISFYSLEMAR